MKKIILAVLVLVSSSFADKTDAIASGIGALIGLVGGITNVASASKFEDNITRIIGKDVVDECDITSRRPVGYSAWCKAQAIASYCLKHNNIEACALGGKMGESYAYKDNIIAEDLYAHACYLGDENSCNKLPQHALLEAKKKQYEYNQARQDESRIINKYYGLLDYDIAKTFDKGGLSPLVLKKNCNSKAVSGRTIILSNPFSVKGQCAIATVTIVKVDSPNTAIAEISGKPVYIVNSGNTLSNRILGNNTRFLWLFKVTGTTTLSSSHQGNRVVPILKLL